MVERSQTHINNLIKRGASTQRFAPVEKPAPARHTPESELQLPGTRGTIGQLLETPAQAVTSLVASQTVFERMHNLTGVDTESKQKISKSMRAERRKVLRDLFNQRDDVEAKTRRNKAATQAAGTIIRAADLYKSIR